MACVPTDANVSSCRLGFAIVREAPEQAAFTIEERARVLIVDGVAQHAREIEGAEDLGGAATGVAVEATTVAASAS